MVTGHFQIVRCAGKGYFLYDLAACPHASFGLPSSLFIGMLRNGKGVGRGVSGMPRKENDGGDRDVRGGMYCLHDELGPQAFV